MLEVELASRLRPFALLGGSLAVLSGAWFAVGGALAPLWTHNLHAQGFPIGGHIAKAMEQVGFFPGLGVAIVSTAANEPPADPIPAAPNGHADRVRERR